ncbi:Neuronal PAS domain-containing protein 4 [Aphelenchoides fujianensis]|nr:Neuronal PAS domain-containing protein 4 [Aphelenchoides fujianensis]
MDSMDHCLHYQQLALGNEQEDLDLPARSTRGASKQRRDQINIEIQRLRDLLPLSGCVKDRLFQLQVMSLSCVYIRKQRYLPHILQTCEKPVYPLPFSSATPKGVDAYKTLRGFMLLVTQSGKLLHISENAAEYLGSSVEELMCQGDSIFDLTDARDHAAVHAQLAAGPLSVFDAEGGGEERAFVCRMNLSRTAKRQVQHYKFVAVEGRFIHPAEFYKTLNAITNVQPPVQPIFAAFCTPLLTPDNVECLNPGNTEVFHSTHRADLRFVELDAIGAERLGYAADAIGDLRWYELLHPEQVPDFAERHRLLVHEMDGSIVCLSRVRTGGGEWTWLHSVFTIRNEQDEPLISGVHQTIGELQAESLRQSPWIYATKHFESFRDPHKTVDSAADSLEFFGQGQTKEIPIRVSIPAHHAPPLFADLFDANNNAHEVKIEANHSVLPTNSSFHSDPNANRFLCLEQLLYAPELFAPQLPELHDDDLAEYFRQVEHDEISPSTSNNSLTHEPPERGIKREFASPDCTWPPPLPPVHSLSVHAGDSSSFKRHRSSFHFEKDEAENNNNHHWSPPTSCGRHWISS